MVRAGQKDVLCTDCSDRPCIAGGSVLHIHSTEKLWAIMQKMQRRGELTTEQLAQGKKWLKRLRRRQADGHMHTPDTMYGSSRFWHLGAVMGDGHVHANDDGVADRVTHHMQVRKSACTSA